MFHKRFRFARTWYCQGTVYNPVKKGLGGDGSLGPAVTINLVIPGMDMKHIVFNQQKLVGSTTLHMIVYKHISRYTLGIGNMLSLNLL